MTAGDQIHTALLSLLEHLEPLSAKLGEFHEVAVRILQSRHLGPAEVLYRIKRVDSFGLDSVHP